MAEIRVDVTFDDAKVKAAVKRVKDALEPPKLTESVGDGADAFVTAVQAAAPEMTGQLRRSITKTPDGELAFKIGPDPSLPYAAIQNFGGDIFPRTALALRFEIGGAVIFAQHVHIPGTHYVETGFAEGLDPALQAVKKSIDKHIAG